MHAWCLLVPCPCLISEPCVHSVSLPPASSASGRLQSNPVQNDGVQCLSPIDVSNEASHGATTFAVAGDFPALSAGWVLHRRCVDRHRLLSCSMLYHVRSFFFFGINTKSSQQMVLEPRISNMAKGIAFISKPIFYCKRKLCPGGVLYRRTQTTR